MLLDADDLEHDATREGDVCVIGAGAAGITLARELARRGLRVCLLEGGGLDLEDASQQLYAGAAEPPLADEYLVGSRLRFLGGTTNHWLGYCRPLDAWDFEAKSWISYSGWPITRAELDPWYARATEVLEIPTVLPRDRPLAPGHATGLVVGSFHRNALRFRNRYVDELRSEPLIELMLHASAVELALSPGGRVVDHVVVATPGRRRLRLRARRFVLALGAIENARLLLSSDAVAPGGVGNERDLVGRFFMDHAVFSQVARLATKSTAGPFHARPAGSSYEACLVDGAGQQEQGIGGCAFALDLLPAPEGPMESKLAALRTPTLDHHLSELYPAPALRGAEPAGLWTRAFDVRPESAPDPESRVLLDAEVDANGQRKVRLRLRQGPFEGRTAARALELLASAVGRHGLGRLWIEPDVGRWRVEQGFHHAGTTRMHDDPAHGVVDRHGRVHSVDNLFVTGGSVFPTAGAVNPTFTIVALALRLADRLVESA